MAPMLRLKFSELVRSDLCSLPFSRLPRGWGKPGAWLEADCPQMGSREAGCHPSPFIDAEGCHEIVQGQRPNVCVPSVQGRSPDTIVMVSGSQAGPVPELQGSCQSMERRPWALWKECNCIQYQHEACPAATLVPDSQRPTQQPAAFVVQAVPRPKQTQTDHMEHRMPGKVLGVFTNSKDEDLKNKTGALGAQ